MSGNKKTLKNTKINKGPHIPQNIIAYHGQNKSMTKNEQNKNEKCNIQLMPTAITDADINSLFSGLVGIVRRKVELEARAEIIGLNLTQDKLLKELKNKQAECNRLKNEILHLKAELANRTSSKL